LKRKEYAVQSGFAIWLTGLPAAGKTSLARALRQRLAMHRIRTLILDSDDLRRVLTPNPTYTEEERDWFYGMLAFLAAWLTQRNINVLIAATAHKRSYRDSARAQIMRFAEVYVRCSPETCQKRDPKGIYALAHAGQATDVPGVQVAYEAPLHPESIVDTDQLSPDEAAAAIIDHLQSKLIVTVSTTCGYSSRNN
jgi:adenylylsulfate kinase